MSQCFDDNTAVEFIDGLLSQDEERRVESHAARCDECRRLLAALGQSPSLPQFSPTLPAGGEAHINLNAGQEVGRFQVLSRIGSGGMGVVFAAYDPKLDRKVALKLLHSPEGDTLSSQKDAQMRLLREAQAIAQLSHPNVISVYDVGTFQSEVYIAMEFVEGETLTRWLRTWERPWPNILDKFVQAGKALVDAHASGLVHRDFKPDNVLVGSDGRVRVMDFGLARWLYAEPTAEEEEARTRAESSPPTALSEAGQNALERRLTKTGTLLGTPRYMAPEQFAGLTADARSDQFSFCVALYEALYHQHPFEENTSAGLVRAPETTEVRPPPVDSKAPPWLLKAILRGLSGDPMERFASMGAFLRELAPMPKPEPQLRFIALLATALIAITAATYFYSSGSDAREHLAVVEQNNQELELQLGDLQRQVTELGEQLSTARNKLKESRGQKEILALRKQLAETSTELEETLEQLRDTEEKLTQAVQKGNWRPQRPDTPRLAGLGRRQILKQVYRHYEDLEVCFREFFERETDEQRVFAVRLTITGKGTPKPGSRSGGIADQVVYECAAGLLENIRFPSSDATTIVNLGFRNTDSGLRISAKVKEVRADDESDG